MRFRRLPIDRAVGHVLGHNVPVERGRLRKGTRIDDGAVTALRACGRDTVYVAELTDDDVTEDEAARRLARALLAETSTLRLREAKGGRISLRAACRGVVGVDTSRLLAFNLLEGVTLAARPRHDVVTTGDAVATLKIIPFGIPHAVLEQAREVAERPLVWVQPLRDAHVHVLICGSPDREHDLVGPYRNALQTRLAALGCDPPEVSFVRLTTDPEASLCEALLARVRAGDALVIVATETATMDRDDTVPTAIRLAGGSVLGVGAPVFPGNLVVVGTCGGASILGAPGCVRTRGRNVVDLLLPRLLAGEQIGARELAELGAGGLLLGGAR